LLIKAAQENETEQLILLSTDKAVDPVSIMGVSKRIAELAVLTPHDDRSLMKAVRLGQCARLGRQYRSPFLRQMLSGMPVTVTDPEVRRYFLTTADAVTLLLEAAYGAGSGRTGERGSAGAAFDGEGREDFHFSIHSTAARRQDV
jgi:FlaA1/EpsC-like NDP-sugar epimerase